MLLHTYIVGVGVSIGFRDTVGGITQVREGDSEVILVVTSDGRNQEEVSVEYILRSGTALGTNGEYVTVYA